MEKVGPLVVTVIGSVVLLAMIAVVVSQRAQTPQVISATGSALSAIIGAAVSPVASTQANNFGSPNGG